MSNSGKGGRAESPGTPGRRWHTAERSMGNRLRQCFAGFPRRGWRFLPAGLFIAGYLGMTAVFTGLHVLGDSGVHPIAYFWTWDMFPGYTTASHRRIALGRTEGGKTFKVYPGPAQRFRMGIFGDLTRIDFLPTAAHGPGQQRLRSAVEATLRQIGSRAVFGGDRVVRIYLLERYSPPRFNLPDSLYESVYGEPNPRRRYWRRLGEADVAWHGPEKRPQPHVDWNQQP